LLSEIQPDLFALILEAWEIWLRWQAAYRQGEVTIKSHPALPEERARHDELVQVIGDRRRPDRERGIIKWARFRAGHTEVQWLDAPAPEAVQLADEYRRGPE
jgi:hypothetical protein